MDEKSEASDDFKDGISVQHAMISELYQKRKPKIMKKISDKSTVWLIKQKQQSFIRQSQVLHKTFKFSKVVTKNGRSSEIYLFIYILLFSSLVLKNREISQVEKLECLRSKVKGEAYQIVKRLDLVEPTFDLGLGITLKSF